MCLFSWLQTKTTPEFLSKSCSKEILKSTTAYTRALRAKNNQVIAIARKTISLYGKVGNIYVFRD